MALLVTHTTAADGTFSSDGATAWNATHTIAGTIDLATETTGTIDLLTQTSGATANQLMYGGASGQVAQSANLTWNNSTQQLLVNNDLAIDTTGFSKKTDGTLFFKGFNAISAGAGGAVEFNGGNASTSGPGGAMVFRGGNAAGGTNSGGAFDVAGGNGSGASGAGGNLTMYGGDNSGATGFGGEAVIGGGNTTAVSSPGGAGGSAYLVGGSCFNVVGTPGDVYLLVGGNPTTGPVGKLIIGVGFGSDPIAVTAGTGAHAADLPVIVDGNQYYIRLYS
jgi:hypothetical protein